MSCWDLDRAREFAPACKMLLHTPPIVNMHHDEMRRYTGRPPSLLDARSSRHLPESAHAPNQRRSRKNSYRHPRVCRTAVSGQGGGPHQPRPDRP
ncbi:hypothetical protein PXNS11_60279 [Stutzerimonas xanthomarina]|nr:hypothetical protein PXNS11_60279 [Stutzerimonas xanthomarina]